MSKPKQKFILILTDEPDNTVSMELEFKPSIKGDAKTTPALDLALQLVEHARSLAVK